MEAQPGGEVTILLYDEIGWFGIDAKTFANDLKAVDADTINLRINSPGGSVFDGVAIYNTLRNHKARVITHIDGLAASIASVIALAGDEIRMASNAFFMIHNPWTVTIGDSEQLRKDADVLDKIGDQLLASYVQRIGAGSEEKIRDWMDEETWFNAEEAEAAGFIDEINHASGALASFDLSVFSNAPATLVAAAHASPTKRDVERALRDAGLSRAEAVAFAASGFQAIETQRDAVDPSVVESARALLATIQSAGA